MNLASSSEELSDDELETISGGFETIIGEIDFETLVPHGAINYQVGVPSMGFMNRSTQKW